MTGLTHRARRWAALWPLVLLAVVARLTLGGLAAPQVVLDDPSARLAGLVVLCDGVLDQDHAGRDTAHHHPAGDDGLMLLADALDMPALGGSLAGAGLPHRRPAGMAWMFPPVRGPPFRQRSPLCPQGPPALT